MIQKCRQKLALAAYSLYITRATPKNCIAWLFFSQVALIQPSQSINGLLAKDNSTCHHHGELECPRVADKRTAQSMDQVEYSPHSLHRPLEAYVVWWPRSSKSSHRGRLRELEDWFRKGYRASQRKTDIRAPTFVYQHDKGNRPPRYQG